MYTLFFSEIGPGDASLVGGKGFSLARLTRIDVPVPDGFVVTTAGYLDTMRTNGISGAGPRVGQRLRDANLPARLEREIVEALARLGGTHFAVRSSSVSEDSADRSFAGVFDSFLNVTAENVIEQVKMCYASAHSPRARHYLHAEEPIAVVVQTMVDSRLSGVLFTQDPTGANGDSVRIEACHGLGELLVSGEVTPDSYLLDKRSGAILRKRAGRQSVKLSRVRGTNQRVRLNGTDVPITAQELRALVTISRRIEKHFGAPCDVEWCIDDEPVIVQCRPITAVSPAERDDTGGIGYSKRFFSRILSPVFEHANVVGFHEFGQQQFELPFSLSGYHVYQPSVQHPNGEVDIWVNDRIDAAAVGHLKSAVRFDVDYLVRLECRYLRLVDEFGRFCAATEQTDFRACPAGDLVSTLRDFNALNHAMTSIYNAPIFAVIALAEILNEELRSADRTSYDRDFAVLALNGIPNSVFLQEMDRLTVELTADRDPAGMSAADSRRNRELISQYHRRWSFLGCTDVIGDPYPVTYFEKLLGTRSYDDARRAWDLLTDRQRRESDELRSVLEKYPHLHYEITWLRRWLYHRNHTTEDYYRSFQQLRPLLAEVARRLGLTYRALLNLSTDEMIQALEGSITDHRRLATERGTAGFRLEQRGDDAFLGTGIDEGARLERELLKADELEGQIASRGHAVGTVRIVRDPVLEAHRFNAGDVLVTAMTAPSFVPLMERAVAIVTDEGGVLCHAALVSREMGKPCVIAVRNATQILADEMRVEVDAEVGKIRILSGC